MLKTVSNIPMRSHEYWMTNANIFGWLSSCQKSPNGEKRGALIFYGNDAKAKIQYHIFPLGSLSTEWTMPTTLVMLLGSLSKKLSMPAILGEESPCQEPAKDAKKWAFIYWNYTNANSVESFFVGSLCLEWPMPAI